MSTLIAPSNESAEQPTEHPHVVLINNVPTLRGTRIAVRLIAQMSRAGDAVDDILRTYPHLAATAVHDAISYYLDHRSEIEREIVAHQIESVLPKVGGQINARGFVTFSQSPADE